MPTTVTSLKQPSASSWACGHDPPGTCGLERAGSEPGPLSARRPGAERTQNGDPPRCPP